MDKGSILIMATENINIVNLPKIEEIKELPVVELQAKSRDLRLELFNLNLQKSMGTLEKSHRISQIRKDIARVETMLTRIRNQTIQA